MQIWNLIVSSSPLFLTKDYIYYIYYYICYVILYTIHLKIFNVNYILAITPYESLEIYIPFTGVYTYIYITYFQIIFN
jgi:hypothetical protein